MTRDRSVRCTRRDVVLGAAGCLALDACSRSRPPAERPRVSIHRVPAYAQSLFDTVRRIVAEHKVAVRGKRVVLKPNLVEFDPAAPINTHPLLVHAALEAFRAAGAADVRIAEGPGHRRATLDMAEAAGYFDAVPDFERLFTDLNLDETARVRLVSPHSRLRELYLPKTVLGADLLVSLPKMKTHHWVAATLGLKNLFGVVPGGVYGWPKNVLHWAGIEESIADLNRLVPRRFTIVDGIVAMQGNGPIQGNAKAAGVVVAGSDAVAVDATCCRLMGIDPERVRYLRLAETAGQTAEANVEQTGEPLAAVASAFDLLPAFREMRLTLRAPAPPG